MGQQQIDWKQHETQHVHKTKGGQEKKSHKNSDCYLVLLHMRKIERGIFFFFIILNKRFK